jgi:hypothetical protein
MTAETPNTPPTARPYAHSLNFGEGANNDYQYVTY